MNTKKIQYIFAASKFAGVPMKRGNEISTTPKIQYVDEVNVYEHVFLFLAAILIPGTYL